MWESLSFLADVRTESAIRRTIVMGAGFALVFWNAGQPQPWVSYKYIVVWTGFMWPLNLYASAFSSFFALAAVFCVVVAGCVLSVAYRAMQLGRWQGYLASMALIVFWLVLPLAGPLRRGGSPGGLVVMGAVIMFEFNYFPLLPIVGFIDLHILWAHMLKKLIVGNVLYGVFTNAVFLLPPWHRAREQGAYIAGKAVGGLAGAVSSVAELLERFGGGGGGGSDSVAASSKSSEEAEAEVAAKLLAVAAGVARETGGYKGVAGLSKGIKIFAVMGLFEPSALHPGSLADINAWSDVASRVERLAMGVGLLAGLMAAPAVLKACRSDATRAAAVAYLRAAASLLHAVSEELVVERRGPGGDWREALVVNHRWLWMRSGGKHGWPMPQPKEDAPLLGRKDAEAAVTEAVAGMQRASQRLQELLLGAGEGVEEWPEHLLWCCLAPLSTSRVFPEAAAKGSKAAAVATLKKEADEEAPISGVEQRQAEEADDDLGSIGRLQASVRKVQTSFYAGGFAKSAAKQTAVLCMVPTLKQLAQAYFGTARSALKVLSGRAAVRDVWDAKDAAFAAQFAVGICCLFGGLTWWPGVGNLFGASRGSPWIVLAFVLVLRETAEHTVFKAASRIAGDGFGALLAFGVCSMTQDLVALFWCHMAVTSVSTWFIKPVAYPSRYNFGADPFLRTFIAGFMGSYILIASTQGQDAGTAARARFVSQTCGSALAAVVSILVFPRSGIREGERALDALDAAAAASLRSAANNVESAGDQAHSQYEPQNGTTSSTASALQKAREEVKTCASHVLDIAKQDTFALAARIVRPAHLTPVDALASRLWDAQITGFVVDRLVTHAGAVRRSEKHGALVANLLNAAAALIDASAEGRARAKSAAAVFVTRYKSVAAEEAAGGRPVPSEPIAALVDAQRAIAASEGIADADGDRLVALYLHASFLRRQLCREREKGTK